ncbi:Lrp/AsnC family transcriptional regulator [Aliagarivorans marinus]|uniref:Lrp/AsnC family transcriptional regulator n=1 Tax=Aliagarivorans marinus TaxID=561965 RepID=UPI00040D97D3|nr:Lrp/AsnC family transcriptional regulator [Aliagarivorans marinus]
MDKFDRQIISLLVEDARQSVSELARQINLSRSATADRLKHLEEQGIIQGYHARLGSTAATLCAYLELHYREHNCDAYAEQIRAIPEVKRCCAISGQVDMILYVEVESMARLDEIRVILEQMEKMVMVRTHMVLRDIWRRD